MVRVAAMQPVKTTVRWYWSQSCPRCWRAYTLRLPASRNPCLPTQDIGTAGNAPPHLSDRAPILYLAGIVATSRRGSVCQPQPTPLSRRAPGRAVVLAERLAADSRLARGACPAGPIPPHRTHD